MKNDNHSMNDTVTGISETISAKEQAFTLRVRGGDNPTDPVGLSRSILHVLNENPDGFVNIKSVGANALGIVITATQIAASVVEQRTAGSVLVCRFSKYTANINGKKAKGICTRIFPIPTKVAP